MTAKQRSPILSNRRHVELEVKIAGLEKRVHDQIANLFHFPRHSLNAADCQPLRAEAMVAWKELLASAPRYNLSAGLHLGFALTQSS